jgi:hypothetical protein
MPSSSRKKLIVGGCSMTHGAELVDGFMHPGNIQGSYSRHLADWLDADLVNVALSGGSNDDIFHALMHQIDCVPTEQTHSVLAAWTSHNRLHWINKGRHWFFIPGWASSMKDPYNWHCHHHPSPVFVSSDDPNLLPTLEQQHKFLVDNYLDDDQWFRDRLANYKSALRSHCEKLHIRLVEVDIFDAWQWARHPNLQEHEQLARRFYDQFYKS